MKFRKHLSGNKRKDGTAYTSGYDARIPEALLIDAGFIGSDGSLKEYELQVGADKTKIEIIKKDSWSCVP